MVSFGLAIETLKRILRQVHRKHATRFGRAMKRAGAAHLLARCCSGFKVKQFQYVAYRDHRPESAEVDTRHWMFALKQRRGTRNYVAEFTWMRRQGHSNLGEKYASAG
jgi:hypothetical protein